MSQTPPLPQQPYREEDALTRSELMPFRSKKISIWKSRALIPLAATALTCVLLFSIMGSIKGEAEIYQYMYVLSTFLTFAMFAAIYFYVGERKHMLWYLIPVAFTMFQLWAFFLTNTLPNVYVLVFRKILPGHLEGTDFITAFISNFFAAGLLEELLKAIPALIGLVLALRLRRSGQPGGGLQRGLALEGPIDGLLVGVAAGAAFILLETLAQYVPNTVRDVIKNTKGNEGIGYLFGFLLLLPRVLNGIIGHMAWAGISGYFIGLAVSHPRAVWKLLAVGWLLPSVLHALWNSLAASRALGPAGSYVSGALSLFFFVACILKAKQLEVSRLGGPIDGHSILAISPPPTHAQVAPGGIVPPAASGLAGLFTGLATGVEKLVGFTARTTVPNPGSVPTAAPAVPARGLSIGTRDARYALAPNQTIDFSSLFSASNVPSGCSGLISSLPDGTLDIRNTGAATWAMMLPDGATASIPPGGSLKAAPGTKIVLGGATIDIQAY